jgi:rhodanese-related sulfurtransferase
LFNYAGIVVLAEVKKFDLIINNKGVSVKRLFGFVVSAFTLAVLIGCGEKNTASSILPEQRVEDIAVEKRTEYRKISPQEAKQMLDKNPEIILVDVRNEDDYAEVRIPGSILIPKDVIEEKAAQALPDKDAVILVYCKLGIKSKPACEMLIGMGYTNVYDMGGMTDWPYETEKD